MNAEVSINKQLVRVPPYGYSSFVVDITPYLLYGQENTVNVIANNTAQPNSRWYTGTGIYRHVWLRVGGQIHIPPWGIFVTTPIGGSPGLCRSGRHRAGRPDRGGCVRH
jgi:beta-galactosidase